MSKIARNFSIRLKALRKEKGLRQSDLASAADMSTVQIGRYEAGEQLPRAEALENLAQALDTTPEFLFGGGWQERLLDGLPTRPEWERAGEKLKEIRAGRDAREIAKKAGIPFEHVIWYEGGVSIPAPDMAAKLAEALGCKVDDFMPPQQPEIAAPKFWDTEFDLGDDYVVVPFYHVSASAGPGATAQDSPAIKGLAFRQDWIHRKGCPPLSLSLITVVGDSMEPTLSDGDTVMICAAQDKPRDAALYVIRIDGDLLIKRLQRLPGQRIKVKSDNPAYGDYEIDLTSLPPDFKIIGRVVWIAREL